MPAIFWIGVACGAGGLAALLILAVAFAVTIGWKALAESMLWW